MTARRNGQRWRDRKPQPVHRVIQQQDEYACKCGVRWPVTEGKEHP